MKRFRAAKRQREAAIETAIEAAIEAAKRDSPQRREMVQTGRGGRERAEPRMDADERGLLNDGETKGAEKGLNRR
jgi:restriction endonuclease Mrr